MGEITVYFIGICTFMQDIEEKLPGVRRRVVLVNAREPEVINNTVIPPHIPTLRIAASDLEVNGVPATTANGCVLEWELHGCKIEIVEPLGDLQHDETFECCIPHLKALTPDANGVSTSVVLAAEPEVTSCYFDLSAGQLGPSWTYWSWNPNSNDTGGILKGDWKSVEQEKVDSLRPVQFPVKHLERSSRVTPR